MQIQIMVGPIGWSKQTDRLEQTVQIQIMAGQIGWSKADPDHGGTDRLEQTVQIQITAWGQLGWSKQCRFRSQPRDR